MTKKEYSTAILTIEEVASWWLPLQLENIQPDVKAQLPVLQRGFVWKPGQVEKLWDSLIQGFPVGSLLLARICGKSKTVEGRGAEGAVKNPTHILLDGQQRATSIALGFRNIWLNENKENWASLWVDLESSKSSDRQFDFRMITKSHPWGYRRTDPSKTISSSSANKAMAVFHELLNDDENKKPHELSLEKVFPWDAKAPIPVALLISAIQESKGDPDSIPKRLLEKLEIIALYAYAERSKEIANEQQKEIQARKNEITERISNDNQDFNTLVNGMKDALENAEIPAPVLRSLEKKPTNDKKDPVFTLFERINNAGTNLSIEEINYSQLKTVWPEAPKLIEEKILNEFRIAKPARLVTVLTRLYLMNEKGAAFRSELTIKDFGTFLIKHKDRFEAFCENKGPRIVEDTWKFLTNKPNGLPKVLAGEVAQKSSNLMLLIMLWIDHMRDADPEYFVSQNSGRERTLGFFTAIVWFSSNAKGIEKCAKKLAEDLQNEIKDKHKVSDFFDSVRFNSLFCDKDNVLLIPLPEPVEVRKALKSKILDNMSSVEIWGQKWWDKISDPEQEIVSYFNEVVNSGDDNSLGQELWLKFFKKIRGDRRFLLYAQRKFIKGHFDWFDPILPDQTQDRNRPWDYDHILPHSWTQHSSGRTINNTPQLVSAWVHANGNFRAWPYELNRSKGNDFIFEVEAPTYELNSKEDVVKASFVNNTAAWKALQNSKVEEFRKADGCEIQQQFITASINRTVDIYEEWYKQLYINDLTHKLRAKSP